MSKNNCEHKDSLFDRYNSDPNVIRLERQTRTIFILMVVCQLIYFCVVGIAAHFQTSIWKIILLVTAFVNLFVLWKLFATFKRKREECNEFYLKYLRESAQEYEEEMERQMKDK